MENKSQDKVNNQQCCIDQYGIDKFNDTLKEDYKSCQKKRVIEDIEIQLKGNNINKKYSSYRSKKVISILITCHYL
ncbi:unnamed protein product [Paramecium primaurelia]|uniref:Uncharacterized protein n=1 Tax=Paramecium primaurelia TaxID=5886 RepID=A0A8S1P2D0_PARPR|nr:unnamed protein product [Paramecium primaurelia]